MFIVCAMVGVAVAWLWFGPFDHLDDRVRRGLVAAGCAVFVLSCWATWAAQQSMLDARERARAAYEGSRDEKNSAVQRILRENAEPGSR